MDWYFSADHILTEAHSGFDLYLIKGTWSNPKEISPEFPDDMPPREQVMLIRAGVQFAKVKANQPTMRYAC